MVHRDLKPANLMVSPPQQDDTLISAVKILDIGIGRELFDEDSAEGQKTPLTVEGAVLGTPDYLAPEQARDARTADVRADIYSLGCVLFHLVAGRPPFPAASLMGQMVRHATEAPPPLTTGGPPGLQAVFERMVAKDPGDRPQTPTEAADALAAFLPASGGTAVAPRCCRSTSEWLEKESSTELPAVVVAPAVNPTPVRPVAARPARPRSTWSCYPPAADRGPSVGVGPDPAGLRDAGDRRRRGAGRGRHRLRTGEAVQANEPANGANGRRTVRRALGEMMR